MSEEMGERLVNWSDLPSELWPNIGRCLDNNTDVLRFRSVCNSWRSSIPSPHTNPPSFPLNLPCFIPSSSILADLTQTTLYRLELPDECFDKDPSSSSSSKGWLVKVEESNSQTMRLLNPLTDHKFLYPPGTSPRSWNLLHLRITELCKSCTLRYLGIPTKTKVVFFPNSPWTNADYSVVCCIFPQGNLTILRDGDEEWKLLDHSNLHFDDLIVYKGRIYVTDSRGTISWVDISSLKLIQCSSPLSSSGNKKHLVESCGELHVVDRYEHRRENDAVVDEDAVMVDFKVYKLNQECGTWVDVKSLEDRVFVLGGNCNFSFSAKEVSGFQENCVFITDSSDARMFNLNDHSVVVVEPDLFWPPQSWLWEGENHGRIHNN